MTALKSMIDETIKPLPVATVGLVVTGGVADQNNVTTVTWSDGLGSGVSAYAPGSSITLPTLQVVWQDD